MTLKKKKIPRSLFGLSIAIYSDCGFNYISVFRSLSVTVSFDNVNMTCLALTSVVNARVRVCVDWKYSMAFSYS